MEDLDFIKKCCEKAEGFEMKGEYLYTPVGAGWSLNYIIETEKFKKEMYPLLLQRAIEGVNREESLPTIDIFFDKLVVNFDSINKNAYLFRDFNWTIDQAKRSALEYIFNQQEQGNG